MNVTVDRLQHAFGAAYVIERELGGGGMSLVFVAHEAALDREVVIKVLQPGLAGGLSGQRFKREVRLAARLQHAHIVPLISAGEIDGGILYYTMPYVEGETLRDRLAREGALPIGESVRMLCDIASALDYAHRAGVVHRDVKPENILLSHGGAVVADFGIAKAIHASRERGGDLDARRSSTLTAIGTSLGTPAYMAPEQAAGDDVDPRADLYALGVVGYEMLAGRAPFEGRTAQQLLAAHATQEPEPITRRRQAVSPALGALVMRLLEKNPADRPQSADEVRRTLNSIETGRQTDRARATSPTGVKESEETHQTFDSTDFTQHRTPIAPGRGRRDALLFWAIFGVMTTLLGVAAGAMFARARTAPSPQRSVIATLTAPAGQELRPEGGLALSPDGGRLAFVAVDRNGATAVWVRALDSLTATRIADTDGGFGPFWSPDGGSLGFFASGQLQVVDLRRGTRRALCPASRPGGGTWTGRDVIVYTPDFLSAPLYTVAAGGGPCRQLTRYRPGESIHRRPSALPDGRHVLFTTGFTGASGIFAADVETGAITDVRRIGYDAQFAPPHWILFRDGANGQLYAQRLDLSSPRLLGEPRLLLERVALSRFSVTYAVGARALVAFQMGDGGLSLVWSNRQSVIVDSVRAPADAFPIFGLNSASVSHDGRRIAFAAGGPLWLHDRDRNVMTRTHAQMMTGQGIADPAWGPGDSVVAFRTLFNGPFMLGLYHLGTDRSDSLFSTGRRSVRNPTWSPDGRRIAFHLSAGDSVPKDEIWTYSFAERRGSRLWDAAGNLSAPNWSPDGQWMAYVSDETGAPEVYVRTVSDPSVATRVSPSGGEVPRWRADGRELYYRAPDGAIMAVDIRLGSPPALSPPRVAAAGQAFSPTVRWFDITPDGQRFLAFGREDPLLLTLVLDWAAR